MSRESGDFARNEELRYQIERLLARTCMACEGQSESLDQLLGDLRKYMRGQDRAPDRLRAFQEQLDLQLEQLDEHRLGVAHKLRKALGDLTALLESRQRSRQGSRELRALRDELGTLSSGDSALVTWLDRLAVAASLILAGPEERGESARRNGQGGFLDRWFSRAPESTLSADTQPERYALEGAEDPCADERLQRLGIVRRVAELMAEILDQVQLPPETPLERAVVVIDDLREHISGLPFHFQGQPVSVTFSAGLSSLRAGIDDVDQIFDEADKALYQAKENGRNQVQQAGLQDTGSDS